MVVSFCRGVIVGRPADVLVGERGSGRWRGQRLAVEAVRENRLHAAIARGPERAGAATCLLDPRGVVAAGEAEDPEAGAEALFGMGAALEDLAHDRGRLRPDRLGPADEPRGRPLRVAPVGVGAMRRVGREAAADVAPAMRGDAAAVAEDLHHRRGGTDVYAFAHERVGDAVVVVI